MRGHWWRPKQLNNFFMVIEGDMNNFPEVLNFLPEIQNSLLA
jgi:hypothetical protein